VGGLDPELHHDWSNILADRGLLSWDTTPAFCVRLVAVGLMLWALWQAWQWQQESGDKTKRAASHR